MEQVLGLDSHGELLGIQIPRNGVAVGHDCHGVLQYRIRHVPAEQSKDILDGDGFSSYRAVSYQNDGTDERQACCCLQNLVQMLIISPFCVTQARSVNHMNLYSLAMYRCVTENVLNTLVLCDLLLSDLSRSE